MSKVTNLLQDLADALTCLPGVGPKSAQRMAFHVLQRDRAGGERLGRVLQKALTDLHRCQSCQNFSGTLICDICASSDRNAHLLCVVESPADLLMIEQTESYRGHYFVLMGKISPLDGLGPNDIGFPKLLERVSQGEVQEVIIATNFTVEGEATAHGIESLLRNRSVKVSRLASGLPVGGELEYVDTGTLAHALADRRDTQPQK